MTRAAEILTQAGVPDEWHDGVTANNRGTAIFISFKEASQLRLASNKIRRLNVRFGEAKPWLDARRTRAENRPSRCIHKAAEAIEELHQNISRAGASPPFSNITKNMKHLCVQSGEGGPTVCFFDARKSELVWTQAAQEAYTALGKEAELGQIAGWCTLE